MNELKMTQSHVCIQPVWWWIGTSKDEIWSMTMSNQIWFLHAFAYRNQSSYWYRWSSRRKLPEIDLVHLQSINSWGSVVIILSSSALVGCRFLCAYNSIGIDNAKLVFPSCFWIGWFDADVYIEDMGAFNACRDNYVEFIFLSHNYYIWVRAHQLHLVLPNSWLSVLPFHF